MPFYLLVYTGYTKNCSCFLTGGLELSVVDTVPFLDFLLQWEKESVSV